MPQETKKILGGGGNKELVTKRSLCKDDIYVIARHNLKAYIQNLGVSFIDEDSLLDNLTFKTIHSTLLDPRPCGWFFQQFLKMAYSFVCQKEFYLSWDCDSLLIKEFTINLDSVFLNALPARISPNHPYYNTFTTLLNLKFNNNYQFMCEFMIFNKSIMQDLCKTLNQKQPQYFYQPIISLVNKDSKTYSFSEFETYANFVLNHYKDTYQLQFYPVYRCGARFFKEIPSLDNALVRDFGKTYYMLQFNHWDNPVPFARILHNQTLRKIIGFKNLMRIYFYGGFYKRDFKYRDDSPVP